MTIDGLNEVKLRAIEMALDIIRDESCNPTLHIVEDKDKKDLFTLADKIYNYISVA